MQDFIRDTARRLGMSESAAFAATGAVLRVIAEQAGAAAWRDLSTAVPDAAGLLAHAPVPARAEGTRLLFGDATLGLTGLLQRAGLGLDDILRFVPAVVAHLRRRAGPGAVARVLERVVELKQLAG